MSAEQEESKAIEVPKVVIPITEPSTDTRQIPKVLFIENVEAWVDKYTDDALFAQMNELYCPILEV